MHELCKFFINCGVITVLLSYYFVNILKRVQMCISSCPVLFSYATKRPILAVVVSAKIGFAPHR